MHLKSLNSSRRHPSILEHPSPPNKRFVVCCFSAGLSQQDPQNLRDYSLHAHVGARARGGRKRRTSHLPLLSPPLSHQHDYRAGRRHSAPRKKESTGTGSSSGGMSRASSVNRGRGGLRRIQKRERPLARGNHHLSSSCFSPSNEVEGPGGRGGGGTQHGCRRNPLDDSPYANRMSSVNKSGRQLPIDLMDPGYQRPLPVLSITARAPEERKTNGISEEEKKMPRATDEHKGERKRCSGKPLSPSSDGGGDEVGSTAALDSPRSVNSAKSFETLAPSVNLPDDYDNTITAASSTSSAVEGEDGGQAKRGLGVVNRTLFESWRELPWQARVCPRAIEDQEVVRRAAALEAEVTDASQSPYKPAGYVFCRQQVAFT